MMVVWHEKYLSFTIPDSRTSEQEQANQIESLRKPDYWVPSKISNTSSMLALPLLNCVI